MPMPRAAKLAGIALAAICATAFAQVPFEQATRDLASADAATRLRAVQLLKQTAYAEAAIPLAAAVTDADDAVQLEAIAAELNIFLADPVVPRKRVALLIEKRGAVQAEPAFALGAGALGARPVPLAVLTALRTTARDENPRVAIEALYAFGALAVQPAGLMRRDVLRAAGPDIAAFIGSSDPAMRYAAVRVLGRVFSRRAGDEAVESTIGDAVITALNDNDRAVKLAAMLALGAMRYERGMQALTDLFTYYGKGDSAEAALDALAHIAHPGSLPLFTAQMAGKSATLRGIAIEGLARLGDRTQLAAIQAVVDHDRDAGVSLAGAFAQVLLGNAATDSVADALGRPRMREQAKRYLVEIAPGRTGTFGHQLLDSDAQIRLDVVDALGLAGDPAAITAIEPLTQDRDPLVARAAERALARLRAAESAQR
jgi:HEAT repeat protein